MENRKEKSGSDFGGSLIRKSYEQFNDDFLTFGRVDRKKRENRNEWDCEKSRSHKGDVCASRSLSPSNSTKDDLKSYFRDDEIDKLSFLCSPVSFASASEISPSQESGESCGTGKRRKYVKTKSKPSSMTERCCSLFRSATVLRLVEENEACYMALWAAEVSASSRQPENDAPHYHPDDHVREFKKKKKNSYPFFSPGSFSSLGLSPSPRRPLTVLSSSPPEEGPPPVLSLSCPSSNKKVRISKQMMQTKRHRVAFKVRVQKVNNRSSSNRKKIRDVEGKNKRKLSAMAEVASKPLSVSCSRRSSSLVRSSRHRSFSSVRTLQSNLSPGTSIDKVTSAQTGAHPKSEEKSLPFAHSFMLWIRTICGHLRAVRQEVELFTPRVTCCYSSLLRTADQRHLWQEVIHEFQMHLFDCGKMIKDTFASFFLHFSDSFSACSLPQRLSKSVSPQYTPDHPPFDEEERNDKRQKKKDHFWSYRQKKFREEPTHGNRGQELQDLQKDLETCQSDAVAVFHRVERFTRNPPCGFSSSDDEGKRFPFNAHSRSSLSKENTQRNSIIHEHSQQDISSSLNEVSHNISSQNTFSCGGSLREWTEASAVSSLDYSICSYKEKEKLKPFSVPFYTSSSRVSVPLSQDAGSSVSLVSSTVLLSLLSSVLETWSSVRLSLELLLQLMEQKLQKT